MWRKEKEKASKAEARPVRAGVKFKVYDAAESLMGSLQYSPVPGVSKALKWNFNVNNPYALSFLYSIRGHTNGTKAY